MCPTYNFVAFYETKNRTLEEIQLLFNSGTGGPVCRVFPQARLDGIEKLRSFEHE